MTTKIFPIIFIFFFLIILNFISPLSAYAKADWEIPDLQIKFFEFSPAQCEKGVNGQIESCEVPWIYEYIVAIYKYAVGVVGILAVIVMMFGGVLRIVSGGNASRVSESNAWITASLTGLVLVLSSYMILYYVNPSIIQNRYITISAVPKIEGDENGRVITAADISALDIQPGSIQDVVNQMIGKYTYSQEKRLTSENGVNYIDCSSFACTVLIKAGVNAPTPSNCSTATLFAGRSPQAVDLDKIPEGTLVGFPGSANKKEGAGHVWVSLGDGKFAEARGGTEGRRTGNSIRISSADAVQRTIMDKTEYINAAYIYP